MRREYFRTTYISKEAVDLLKSTAFYFGSPNKETGELRKSPTYWIRACNILNIISQANSSGNSHLSKHKSFRDSISAYSSLNPILSTLQQIGILNITPRTTKIGSDSYTINYQYRGKCEIGFTKYQLKILDGIHKKPFSRGKKATTDLEIRINISQDDFVTEMGNDGKDSETIDEQWATIQKINLNGNINPWRKRDSRLYSDFTGLSKIVHKYLTIGNEKICEFDQHATYFSLLPSVLRNIFHVLTDNQNRCLRTLTDFIVASPNIYEQISKQTNLEIKKVKENTNSFICDPKIKMIGEKEIIQNWFRSMFPHCSELIDLTRKSKRLVNALMKTEADIFVFVANELKKNRVQAITKHDSIIFRKQDKEIVKQLLDNRFVNKNIPNKLSFKDYQKPIIDVAPSSQVIPIVPTVTHGITLVTDKERKTAPLRIGGRKEETIVFSFSKTPILSAFQGDTNSLSVTSLSVTRNRATEIKQQGDYFYVRVKGKKKYSTKNESKQSFKSRIEKEFPNILWKS